MISLEYKLSYISFLSFPFRHREQLLIHFASYFFQKELWRLRYRKPLVLLYMINPELFQCQHSARDYCFQDWKREGLSCSLISYFHLFVLTTEVPPYPPPSPPPPPLSLPSSFSFFFFFFLFFHFNNSRLPGVLLYRVVHKNRDEKKSDIWRKMYLLFISLSSL